MVIMESKREESSPDSYVRQRKFGLPDWMVSNMERLNFATDFEQYACSPPETDSFLTEFKDSVEIPQITETFCSVDGVKNVASTTTVKSDIRLDCQPTKLIINPADQLPVVHPSFSNLIKEEFSSPDSTPCATPEQSPVIRRKMSNPSDTVITNPGRWFYMGKVNKLKKTTKGRLADIKNNESKAKCEEKPSVISNAARDSLLDAKNNGIKLMISNFDLNAVSPTSW